MEEKVLVFANIQVQFPLLFIIIIIYYNNRCLSVSTNQKRVCHVFFSVCPPNYGIPKRFIVFCLTSQFCLISLSLTYRGLFPFEEELAHYFFEGSSS